jgi:hypothetical protein
MLGPNSGLPLLDISGLMRTRLAADAVLSSAMGLEAVPVSPVAARMVCRGLPATPKAPVELG